jgi:long-chain acyl-CoA synthetase
VSVYDERPWLQSYPDGAPADLTHEHGSALAMFEASAASAPEAVAIAYLDADITYGELDALSGAFAAALADGGVTAGDRVVLYLQNVPQFLIALYGTWKAGGIVVSANPMLKGKELRGLLDDSGATALVCLEVLHRDVARDVLEGSSVRMVVTTSELEHQTSDDPRVLGGSERIECPGARDMAGLLEQFAGQAPPAPTLGLDDTAFLTYTSGTTGPPKGAMNTHGNVVFNSQVYRDWVGLGSDDVILGVAPLFHITGLIGHIAIAALVGAPLVLMHRFHPGACAEIVEQRRATFTVGSITVFIAMMNAEGVSREQLASLSKILSGGAPIPPSTIKAFQEQLGHYIHNVYGLTETTSPSHGVPMGVQAPVDPTSGALSVGVPVFSTIVRIVGDDGQDLPVGEVGELVTSGPQVVPGYWHKPEETEHALGGGRLRTGDVGYMDEQGFFYIVDRKKDQINAGGYKVWPREVEDVLYEHEAVREAAVIGVPDEYRGETVKAFVSLKPGTTAEPDEIVAFCKERMAAYKYPRSVEILDEIPKTATGKMLRRALRGR